MTVNSVTLIGNLVEKPEVKHMQNGDAIVNMRLATNEQWKDKDGNKQERAEFHKIVIFNKGLCKLAENHLDKGAMLYIVGKLQTRSWQTDAGEKRFSTEIVLQQFGSELKILKWPDNGNKSDTAPQQQQKDDYNPQKYADQNASQGAMNDDPEDSIPF